MNDYNPKSTERAAAIILKNNKLLLFRRIRDGKEYFVFPGGSVEEGETKEDAVVRELKEEMSIDIKIDKLLFAMYVYVEGFDHGRQSSFFLVKEFKGTPTLSGPEKERMNVHNQYYVHWMDCKDIKSTKNLYPDEAREKLIEHLKLI